MRYYKHISKDILLVVQDDAVVGDKYIEVSYDKYVEMQKALTVTSPSEPVAQLSDWTSD